MSRAKISRRMHDVQASESLDKLILLCAFLVGVLGGIILKLLQANAFVAAGFAAVVLVAYALWTFFATHLRLEPEVIGDNCYYLGFLFTLTSLSVTLYFVVEAGSADRAAKIPEVISGFGIALSSTIVGVFLRVLMMQFRVDIVSRERETRVELNDAARRLRVELNGAIARMKDFTVESVQLATERDDKLRQATELVTTQMSQEIRKSAEQISNFATVASQQATEREIKLRQETDKLLQDLRLELVEGTKKILREVETALRAQGTAVSNEMSTVAQNASKGAEDGMKITISSILNTVEELEASSSQAAAEFSQMLNSVTVQTAALTHEVGRVSSQLSQAGDASADALIAVSGKVESASVAIEQALLAIETKIIDGGNAFENASRDTARKSAMAMQQVVEEVKNSGTELGKATARAGNNVESAASDLAVSFEKYAKVLDAAAKSDTDHNPAVIR